MKIDISAEASNYLNKRNNALTIFMGRTDGCCGGSTLWPSYDLGKPRRNLDDYAVLEICKVKVYLAKELTNLPGTARISMDKLFWWKHISFSYQE